MIKIELEEVSRDQNAEMKVVRCNSEGSGGASQGVQQEMEKVSCAGDRAPQALMPLVAATINRPA